MPTVPEFILRKLYVKESLREEQDGFSFAIYNSFAPATWLGFALEVDGQPVPTENVFLQAGNAVSLNAGKITPDSPFALAVGMHVSIRVQGGQLGAGQLRLRVSTREVGELSFGVKAEQGVAAGKSSSGRWVLPSLLKKPFKTDVRVKAGDVIGEVDPAIYGQFVEHLEHCVYGGIWNADGSELQPGVLELIQRLKPPLIRYPGGNFASGYHWEDGIGAQQERPQRYDEAWKVNESNQVGTDEFIEFCRQVGAEPFLVVNCGNGTPEEAARWVAYCNQPADGEEGARRAANGHPQPYHVRLWGVGNEVWGPWQIGHSGAEEYVQRLRQFASAMRAADPDIRLVAVGEAVLSDDSEDAGRLWNEILLRGAGEVIDYLSFHLYQPDQEGWREKYDQHELHHTVCAAPLEAGRIMERITAQIAENAQQRQIGIAFDEWNLWLPPPEGASSMHQVEYCMRDALYTTGMLNEFHRHCQNLKIANLAQLVNVLPLIVSNEQGAYATPSFYTFVMFQQMEKIVLQADVRTKHFDTPALGNIAAQKDVPYVDISATRDAQGDRLVLSMLNRHPTSRTYLDLELQDFGTMKLAGGWLLRHEDPLAVNSFTQPDNVKPRQVSMPERRGKRFRLDLPQASFSILVLEKSL